MGCRDMTSYAIGVLPSLGSNLSHGTVKRLLPTMVWKDMYDFSEDSVLLVLANTHYDGHEYIRDYDEFIKEVGGTRRR